MAAARSYRLAGRVYDLVSLETLLYHRPRLQLVRMVDIAPGSTVVDLGCGTGLNLPLLVRAVGPRGRVVGIDSSPGMLAGARRRVRDAGWANVGLVAGDARDLADLVGQAGVDPGEVDVVVATFVLSVIYDDGPVWGVLEDMAAGRRLRIGLADVGQPDAAPALLRPLYRALAALGGADPGRRPWLRLGGYEDLRTERHLGGHVHVATATIGPARGR